MGLEVIDFSTGTPNIPPTKNIREVLAKAALEPKNYVYAINDLPEHQQFHMLDYLDRKQS